MTTICDSKAAAHTTVAAHISTLMLVEYQCSAVEHGCGRELKHSIYIKTVTSR